MAEERCGDRLTARFPVDSDSCRSDWYRHEFSLAGDAYASLGRPISQAVRAVPEDELLDSVIHGSEVEGSGGTVAHE